MKPVTVEMYEADDGEVFKTKLECVCYELSQKYNTALDEGEYFCGDAGFDCITNFDDFFRFCSDNRRLVEDVLLATRGSERC
jgi:hypothetical protein